MDKGPVAANRLFRPENPFLLVADPTQVIRFSSPGCRVTIRTSGTAVINETVTSISLLLPLTQLLRPPIEGIRPPLILRPLKAAAIWPCFMLSGHRRPLLVRIEDAAKPIAIMASSTNTIGAISIGRAPIEVDVWRRRPSSQTAPSVTVEPHDF